MKNKNAIEKFHEMTDFEQHSISAVHQLKVVDKALKKEKSVITIKQMPDMERPREKLMHYGSASLSNSELLAILVGSGTQNATALTIANRILSIEQDGLGFLTDCMPEELCMIKGVGRAKACQVLAAIELGKRIATYPRQIRIKIDSPQAVADLFMEELRYLKKECFRVLLLNTKNEIIGMEEASIGNLNSSIVHPREIFRYAVRKSAAAMIVVHNHPSGNPEPSQNDIDVTVRLSQAGELIGISVEDHIVIGDGNFVSLRARGFLG